MRFLKHFAIGCGMSLTVLACMAGYISVLAWADRTFGSPVGGLAASSIMIVTGTGLAFAVHDYAYRRFTGRR